MNEKPKKPRRHILETRFRYRPSFDTDLKKTFERVRREQQAAAAPAKAEPKKPDAIRVISVKKLAQGQR